MSIIIDNAQNITINTDDLAPKTDMLLACTDWSSAMEIDNRVTITTSDNVVFAIKSKVFFDTDADTSTTLDLGTVEGRQNLVIHDLTDITDINEFEIYCPTLINGQQTMVEVTDNGKIEIVNLIKNSLKGMDYERDYSDHPIYN